MDKVDDGVDAGKATSKLDDVAEQGNWVDELPLRKTYSEEVLDDLVVPEAASDDLVEHIFYGHVRGNKKRASGYHSTAMENADVEIISGTKSDVDEFGIYTAKVRVKGKKKPGFSSFFPDDYSPQEIMDSIQEAYNSREPVGKVNTFKGKTSRGFEDED